jgi:APA family basic amino acid/polyamine antiporter
MFEKLFRKKSITKILEDAQKGYGEHGTSLHKTLGVRDLTALVLQQLLVPVFSVPLEKPVPTADLL